MLVILMVDAERPQGQGHCQLHSEFDAILGYTLNLFSETTPEINSTMRTTSGFWALVFGLV